MRIIIQRSKEASVTIAGNMKGHIERGLVILLGIEDRDKEEDIEWLCQKVVKLRVFDDEAGVMNLPITAVDGANILLVSQFTLMASTKKGNRPSYINASRPEYAQPLYERFVVRLSELMGKPVETGTFGADMQVSLINDGPVTIMIDSHLRE